MGHSRTGTPTARPYGLQRHIQDGSSKLLRQCQRSEIMYPHCALWQATAGSTCIKEAGSGEQGAEKNLLTALYSPAFTRSMRVVEHSAGNTGFCLPRIKIDLLFVLIYVLLSSLPRALGTSTETRLKCGSVGSLSLANRRQAMTSAHEVASGTRN